MYIYATTAVLHQLWKLNLTRIRYIKLNNTYSTNLIISTHSNTTIISTHSSTHRAEIEQLIRAQDSYYLVPLSIALCKESTETGRSPKKATRILPTSHAHYERDTGASTIFAITTDRDIGWCLTCSSPCKLLWPLLLQALLSLISKRPRAHGPQRLSSVGLSLRWHSSAHLWQASTPLPIPAFGGECLKSTCARSRPTSGVSVPALVFSSCSVQCTVCAAMRGADNRWLDRWLELNNLLTRIFKRQVSTNKTVETPRHLSDCFQTTHTQ